MTLPFVWSWRGGVRIEVSPHGLPRLHSMPDATRERLQQMLTEIAGSAPDRFASQEGLLRLDVGDFVVLYNFAPDGQGLVVQHILVTAEEQIGQTA